VRRTCAPRSQEEDNVPIIRKEVSVAANTTVDNLVTGSIYEFMPFNAALSIGMTGSATGLVGTVNTGSDTLLEESPLNIKATFPLIPDEMDLQDRTLAGERLVVRVRNTTAGALTVRLLVQISPV
jgi:hypothetical protein